ncbi:hypothetical protein [Luteimonas sp. MC1828]|uniref:hypothetical protein n=1 Tax=Luteimonas sp. MC1828 TaxID=2799787 RepID=UPI0018F125A4|nr:hypothetical protein [Luteimonas sp. MC1828]MBJ7575670.1 hypothetical protein [Luteimonas sp. MC1828]
MKSKMAIFATVVAALLVGYTFGNLPPNYAEAATSDASLDVIAEEPAPIEIAPGITRLPGDYEPVNARPEDYAPASDEDVALAAAYSAAAEVASEAKLRVSLQERPGPAYSTITYLVIQSITDNVAIEAVIANRGNCPLLTAAGALPEYPASLKFGSELWLQPIECGGIVEVQVSTTGGTYEYSLAAY